MSRWLLLLVLLAGPAQAQDGCALLWDMALVARAMVEEGVDQPKIVGAMRRIYPMPAPVIEQVTVIAMKSSLPAAIFAERMRRECNGAPAPRPGAALRAT